MLTLKITKGQPFALWIPTIILNANGKEPVDSSTLNNINVTVSSACNGTAATPEVKTYSHWIILNFDENLLVGPYRVEITAELMTGRLFSLRINKPFEIVQWDKESNWKDYIIGDHLELTDTPFITGTFVSDAELEELKQELREKNAQLAQAIEDAEAAKAEWERKAAELDDVAQQTTLMQGVKDIRNDIAGINIDTSDLAKQGTNPNATLSEVQSLLQEIKDAHIINNISLDGYVFIDGYVPYGPESLFTESQNLRYVYDDKLTKLDRYALFNNNRNILEVYFPNLIDVVSSQGTYFYSPSIRVLYVPNANNNICDFYNMYNASCLIDLTIGKSFNSNTRISGWQPAEALRNDTTSLLTSEDIQAGFANNREKLLYNIREHIAALLPDRTGQTPFTLTVYATIKDAINGDTATADAFANKNWVIA